MRSGVSGKGLWTMQGAHSPVRDFAWLVSSWWTLPKTLIINTWRKRISCTFHLQFHWIRRSYRYQRKTKVMSLFSEDRISCQAGVWGEKCGCVFFSPHNYDYHFGPGSPIAQNLASENDLLAWSIEVINLFLNPTCELRSTAGQNRLRSMVCWAAKDHSWNILAAEHRGF